jgi:hypothetical protein
VHVQKEKNVKVKNKNFNMRKIKTMNTVGWLVKLIGKNLNGNHAVCLEDDEK